MAPLGILSFGAVHGGFLSIERVLGVPDKFEAVRDWSTWKRIALGLSVFQLVAFT
jgi:hypothetical protein